MNILYLINYAGAGGSEKYVKLLADAYTDKPYKGNKVFFIYNVDGQLAMEMKKKGATARVEMNHPLDIKAAAAIAGFCKAHKIDVIHCQYPRENFIAILSKLFYRKPRVVYTSHIIIENNLIWRVLNRVMTRFNSGVIAVCNLGAQLLVKNGYCKSKVKVVHNGTEPLSAGRKSNREGGVWDEFCIPPGRFMFTALARLMEVKGLFFLADAVRHLKETTDMDFGVLIAGDGDLRDKLNEYLQKYGIDDRVILAGHRADTAPILEGSDVYLNSSQSEALSFAILEAMSYGLPVIATNVGGTPDIINEQTKAGLLVEYGDVNGYAAAMKKMMTDDLFREECGKNGERAVEDVFNIKQCLKNTFEIYRKKETE